MTRRDNDATTLSSKSSSQRQRALLHSSIACFLRVTFESLVSKRSSRRSAPLPQTVRALHFVSIKSRSQLGGLQALRSWLTQAESCRSTLCSLVQALHAVRVQLLTGVAVSDAHPQSLDLVLHTYALRMNVSNAPGTSDQRSRTRLMSKERYSGSDRSTCGMPMCLCWRGFLTILLTAAPVAGSSRASCQQSSCNCCYPSTLSRKLLCPAKPCHVEHAVLRSSSGNLPSRGACVTSICPFGGTADPFLHSL